MRTVIFGVACSLDNYIARADHSVDWLHWSDDVTAITSELWPQLDAVVMGRVTYEAAVELGLRAYPGVTNYVCSATLKQSDYSEVTIVGDDAVQFVRDLKQRTGKTICVIGGGKLAHSLFEAGLIDEVGLNVHPILLGDGIPLFYRMQRETSLELTETRQLSGGCVLLKYRIFKD